jgi:transcriptional regulator with XRE-family HTH domain
MNAIQKLKDHVLTLFSSAKTEIVAPLRDNGFWSLDVDLADIALSVHWREGSGFDLSVVRPDSYGEGADEHVESFDAAAARIEQLLGGDENISPPINVLLRRVREQRGITQQQLAATLKVKQASISGIERREDIQLSTLRKFVEALGGSIEVFLRFPDGRHRLSSYTVRDNLIDCIPAEPKRRSLKSHPRQASRTAFDRLSSSGGLTAAQWKADRVKEKHSLVEWY